jgi:hypothetical protein
MEANFKIIPLNMWITIYGYAVYWKNGIEKILYVVPRVFCFRFILLRSLEEAKLITASLPPSSYTVKQWHLISAVCR